MFPLLCFEGVLGFFSDNKVGSSAFNVMKNFEGVTIENVYELRKYVFPLRICHSTLV